MTTPTERDIHVERIFNAPRDRVWKAYTDPKLVSQWWGRGNKLVIEKFEPKRDGQWRFVEHSPEEGTTAFSGQFREITPPTRIVQTFGWDGMPGNVIVETANFEDMGDGRTRVKTVSLFETTEERDGMLKAGMAAGMEQSYAALDKLLATLH